jgi:5-methylcytosine-specific restriction endonuclease McrA
VCCKLDLISRRHTWTYRSYMASREWAARRTVALAAAGRRCQRCGACGGLEVHHKHYRTLGAERAEDLEVLCRPCHGSADRERHRRTALENAAALYAARLDGWASRRYGEGWVDSEDYDAVSDEFDDWLDRQEDGW